MQIIALRKDEQTEGMMQSSAENIQGAGDVKPKGTQECCTATTIQTSLAQTQGKAQGRERSTVQLSCQMSEIPMEIYSIHSDNNSG